MSAEGPSHDGQLAAAISSTVVRALARTTGRGPTKAKTTLADNGVFVVLQDSPRSTSVFSARVNDSSGSLAPLKTVSLGPTLRVPEVCRRRAFCLAECVVSGKR
jgi:hypothetical protein